MFDDLLLIHRHLSQVNSLVHSSTPVNIIHSSDVVLSYNSLPHITQNYRYLDLLNVLCVCDGVAIPDNQIYITEHWLRRDRVGDL